MSGISIKLILSPCLLMALRGIGSSAEFSGTGLNLECKHSVSYTCDNQATLGLNECEKLGL